MFHFDPPRKNHQLANWCCLFHVDAVVDCDTRLQVRDVEESRTHIVAKAFQLAGALPRRAGGPGFQTQKNEHHDRRDHERDQGESGRPGKSWPSRRIFLHTAQSYRKKVPPPTPDGREGRLFPPEQSWKTSTLVNELTAGGNKFLPQLTRGTIGIAKKMSISGNRRLNLASLCDRTQCGACAFSLGGF